MQGMFDARTDVIIFRREKNLSFVFQATESQRMDNGSLIAKIWPANIFGAPALPSC